MKQSIKAIQSELGVIGDPSPNAELLLEIRDRLIDDFDSKEDDEITNYDSVLLISNINLGKEVSGAQPICLCAFTSGAFDSMV